MVSCPIKVHIIFDIMASFTQRLHKRIVGPEADTPHIVAGEPWMCPWEDARKD
jgi:hypothetical protein